MLVSHKFKHDDVVGLKYGYRLIGKPKMFAHIYFVDGLLIDTGQSNARSKIVEDTKNLPVDQIFLTHHHEDHSGNIKPLKVQHQCDVFASEECSRIMKNPPKLSFAQKFTWGDRESCEEIIPIGDSLETNKYSFQVIPVPGHSPDMAVLFESDRKWLFSSDLYINSYIGYFIDTESIKDQIDSIKKILELDFKFMFCSHNPQFSNAKLQLSKKLHFLEESFDKVASLYAKGFSAKQIFKELNLKEKWFVKFFSGNHLSKMNMIDSIVRDIKKRE